MTPAEAAREVAQDASARAIVAEPLDAVRWDAISRAFGKFAELLDESEVIECRSFGGALVRTVPAHANPCYDGIACPLADEYPEAHYS